jgi:hypothetical protein
MSIQEGSAEVGGCLYWKLRRVAETIPIQEDKSGIRLGSCLYKRERLSIYKRVMPIQEGRLSIYKRVMPIQEGRLSVYKRVMPIQEG